jgi:hypothetical protein
MKAKKVYEFRTSGEIVRMGTEILIERKIEPWLKIINRNEFKPNITYTFDKSSNTIYLKGEISLSEPKDEFPELDVNWVTEKINACYSTITKLPNNLTTNHLDLGYNEGLNYLPKNLKINGTFSATDSDILELPNDIYVKKSIILNKSKIKHLGNLKIVNGVLNLGQSKIEYLPDNLTINGYLDLELTPIKKLPENLTVTKNLILNWTDISELPDSLKVGSKLILKHTKIDEYDIDYSKFINVEYLKW